MSEGDADERRRRDLRLSERGSRGQAPQHGVTAVPTYCAASCSAASWTAHCTLRRLLQRDKLERALHLVDSISGGGKHSRRLSVPHLAEGVEAASSKFEDVVRPSWANDHVVCERDLLKL